MPLILLALLELIAHRENPCLLSMIRINNKAVIEWEISAATSIKDNFTRST
jgi:hypothetical protein